MRNIVSAPQFTAASFVQREFERHLFVVGSLDKQMQNEKELIRLASVRVVVGMSGGDIIGSGWGGLQALLLVVSNIPGRDVSSPAGPALVLSVIRAGHGATSQVAT